MQNFSFIKSWLEGNHKDQTIYPRILSKQFLNYIRLGAMTTSLGSLFWCLATLSVKNFFLISNLTLPWCSFTSFITSILLLSAEKQSSALPFCSLWGAVWPWGLPLAPRLWPEQTQGLQLLLMHLIL